MRQRKLLAAMKVGYLHKKFVSPLTDREKDTIIAFALALGLMQEEIDALLEEAENFEEVSKALERLTHA